MHKNKEELTIKRSTKTVVIRSSRYLVHEGGLFVISPSVNIGNDSHLNLAVASVSSSDHFAHDFDEGIINGLIASHKPDDKSVLLPVYRSPQDTSTFNRLKEYFCCPLENVIGCIRPDDLIIALVKVDNAYSQDEQHFLFLLQNLRNLEKFILGITQIESGEICLGMALNFNKIRKVDIIGDCTLKFDVTNSHARVVKVKRIHNFWVLMRLLQTSTSLTPRVMSSQCIGSSMNYHGFIYYSRKMTSFNRITRIWYKTQELSSTVFNEFDEETGMDPALATKVKSAIYRFVSGAINVDKITTFDIHTLLESELSLNVKKYKKYIGRYTMNVFGMLERATSITNYLYLGSEYNASDVKFLQSHKIKYVLNATNEIDNFFIGSFTYFNVNVSDLPTENIMTYFEVCNRFIKSARKNKSCVLVHCQRGISRSASIVIAYLMKSYGFGLAKAISIVKRKRPFIQPNRGFYEQLKIYSGILRSGTRGEYFSTERRYSADSATFVTIPTLRTSFEADSLAREKKCLCDITRTYSL